jgi:hypothetical protein
LRGLHGGVHGNSPSCYDELVDLKTSTMALANFSIW